MNKALHKIQSLANFGRILSKIVYIFCFIGAVVNAVGILVLIIATAGNVDIPAWIADLSGETLPLGEIYAGMVSSLIMLLGEAAISKNANGYFSDEMDDGTPFTLDGAKALKRLGLLSIFVPLGTAIASGIAVSVIGMYVEGVSDMDFDGSGSFALGVMFLVMSVVFRYGAYATGNAEEEEK